MYEDIVKAREALDELIKLKNTGNIINVGDYIDSLDEKTCKHVLRMVAYGSYKDFTNEEE
ncbi:hypothetical protein [Tissierella praeacuta]|uniref:hypothetical protein n=1 Tax=Tissierella praeacuta TaxID=43131 RepID=UPI0028B205DA|nr:hypothetical protein [Tissierella praeacuta]